MQALNYTTARNSLKSLIDEVCDHDEEVIITTKNNKSAVLISLDSYNRTHAQIKKEVEEAIAEVERGDFVSAAEAFKAAKKAYRG